MLPAHFHDGGDDVGITVASCYALCSLVILVSYSFDTRVLLGIARSVVFIIPRLLLYFVFDSCTKWNFQIVIYRRKHRESGRVA